MRRRILWLPALLLLAPITLIAQTTRITGRVTDQASMPLEGVRVVEKGTVNVTLTTRDGRYELRISDPRVVIVFSRPGYRDEVSAVISPRS